MAPDGSIAGYVTLSSGKLPISAIPEGYGYPPSLPLPTTLIVRLAVDSRFQNRGIGGDLLVDALRMALKAAQTVASAVIEVDAIDEKARAFYEHFGFQRLPDDELHLYLAISDARRLVDEFFS